MRSRTRGPIITILATVVLTTVLAPAALGQPDLAREAAQPTLRSSVAVVVDDAAAEALWDAAALRTLVADSVAMEPYEGILKGADGALLTGRANATDQALLLAALLERALIPSRFASCELTPIAAGTAPDPAPDTTTASAADLSERAAELAAEIGDPELQAAIAEVVALWEAQRVETDAATEALASALDAVPLQPVLLAAPTQAVARHVWVQAASGADWLDLDTTTEDGSPSCEPTQYFDALPEEWAHQATIAIEVEQRRGDELQRTDAFVYQVPTAELASARVAVTFGEPAGLVEGATGLETVFGGSGRTELIEYTPVILVDGLLGMGRPITLPPPSDTALNLGETIEGISDSLFGEASPDPDAELLEPDPFTGAWIRIELTSPDGQQEVMRSEIFDRIGVVARADGTAAQAEVRPLTEVDGEYAELGALWQVGVLLGDMSLPQVAFEGALALDTVSGISGHLDRMLRMFPSIHRALGGQAHGPIVLLAGLMQVEDAEADEQAGVTAGDTTRLVLDALHVPTAAPADRLAAARDAQALLGAEALLVRLLGDDLPSPRDSVSVLRAAAEEPLAAIGPDDRSALPDDLSPEARLRMAERLAAGYWLLTPRTPPADGTAWWYIDPGTGAVRDEHESGRHSESAEYAGQQANTLSTTERMRRAACRWSRPVILAASLLFAINGGDPGAGQLLKAIAKTAQAAEEQRRRGQQARDIACAGSGGSAGPSP